MKRILIPFITALIVATGCRHQFEEGMVGSFPFLELESGKSLTFPASNPSDGEVGFSTGEIWFSTNMDISTQMTYTSGSATGWLYDFEVTYEENWKTKVKFKVKNNESRKARHAQIVIIANRSTTNILISVTQNEYVIEAGKDNVYNGDLHFTTQEQVDNCIYSKVNGMVYFEGGEIKNVSPLLFNYIRDGISIDHCYNLQTLSPLADVEIPLLLCDYFDLNILRTCNAGVKELVLSNSYSTFDTSILGRFTNATAITVEGCHVNQIDSNVSGLSSLRTLSLKNNDILDITPLLGMTQLEYLDLSENPLSIAQIRYMLQFSGNTSIVANSLSGRTDATVSILETGTKSVNMQLGMAIYGVTGIYGIIYGEKDVPFSQCTMEELSLAYASGYYNYELANLKDGTDYKIWSFVRSDDNVMFLSDSAEFTTVKENFYDLTFTMSYPTFTGETTAPEYSYLEAHTVTISGNSIGSSSIPMTQEGGSYKVTVPEGRNEIFILASNGINNYRSVGYKMTSDHQSAIMVVEDTSTGGFSGDYVIGGYASENVSSNVSTTVNFVRLCTRISVSIDFSDCIGRLDDITKIGLKLDNCYSKVEYQADGTTQYTGNRSYSMSKSVSGVSGTVTVVRDAYIMPSIEGEAVSCTIQLQTPDGILEKTVQLEEGLKANSITSLPLKVSINRTDGTFTIEDVEIVDGGEIEL